jgi:hypothetical protein
MPTTAPEHSTLVQSIAGALAHLPPGGVLSFEDVTWKALRDLVEVLEETGFPRAKLTRSALTLLEKIAAENEIRHSDPTRPDH